MAFAFLVLEDFAVEVLLGLDGVGDLVVLDAHVLIPAHWCVEVEVHYVLQHSEGARIGDGAVKQ